jgi:hypothetical protein
MVDQPWRRGAGRSALGPRRLRASLARCFAGIPLSGSLALRRSGPTVKPRAMDANVHIAAILIARNITASLGTAAMIKGYGVCPAID